MTAAYAPSGRCDRCGARAKVDVLLPSGAALLLCGHHFSQHAAKLATCAAVLPIAAEAEVA